MMRVTTEQLENDVNSQPLNQPTNQQCNGLAVPVNPGSSLGVKTISDVTPREALKTADEQRKLLQI